MQGTRQGGTLPMGAQMGSIGGTGATLGAGAATNQVPTSIDTTLPYNHSGYMQTQANVTNVTNPGGTMPMAALGATQSIPRGRAEGVNSAGQKTQQAPQATTPEALQGRAAPPSDSSPNNRASNGRMFSPGSTPKTPGSYEEVVRGEWKRGKKIG